jgi:hypothetical protein
MIDSPEQRLLDELKKCQLLCATCHKKKTLEKQEFGIESSHGTIWRYKKYKCRCDKCREAMSQYNRNLRKRQLKSMGGDVFAGVKFDEETGHLEYDNTAEEEYYHPRRMNIDPGLLKEIKIECIGKLGKFKIWAVNGDKVREIDPDFTTGANPFRDRYPSNNELWIEMTSSDNETIINSAHEFIESKFMEEEGLDYGHAHDATLVYDITIRRAIDDGYLKAKSQKDAINIVGTLLENLGLL